MIDTDQEKGQGKRDAQDHLGASFAGTGSGTHKKKKKKVRIA